MAESSANPKQPLAYFVPGELVLLVDHPHGQEFSAEDLITEAANQGPTVQDTGNAFERIRRLCDESKVNWRSSRALRFDGPFSSDTSASRSLAASSLLFLDARAEYGSGNGASNPDKLKTFGADIDAINGLGRAIGSRSAGAVTIRAACPNWLTTPFPQAAGGGSPGAWPRTVTTPIIPPAPRFSFAKNPTLVAELAKPMLRDDVEVVILDAAPPRTQIDKVYSDLGRSNPFLAELLRTTSIIYADELGITFPQPPHNFWVDGHDYIMSDHGLFIASLVRMIVPEVKVRVVEVLNEYGIGTLETILCGLQKVLKDHQERRNPVIVNCSFGLATPLSGHRVTDLEWWDVFSRRPVDPGKWELFPDRPKGTREAPFPPLDDWQKKMRGLTHSFESLCESLTGPNVRIVAAAGNDGSDWDEEHLKAFDLKRPQARYPAAFPGVVGVGAIDEDEQPLPYSNLSDRPSNAGYATFGGIAVAASAASPGVAEERTGMLGAYIGAFPQATSDISEKQADGAQAGWAWWAGTSFAAPIISAILACFASQQPPDHSGAVADAVARLERIPVRKNEIGPVIEATQTP